MDHSLLTHMLKYFNLSGINGPDTLQINLPNLSLSFKENCVLLQKYHIPVTKNNDLKMTILACKLKQTFGSVVN